LAIADSRIAEWRLAIGLSIGDSIDEWRLAIWIVDSIDDSRLAIGGRDAGANRQSPIRESAMVNS
jgi:hypothetical protein